MNKKSTCVILHLHYVDLLEYFESYLNNINEDYDLYITLTEGTYGEGLIEKVNSKFKNVKIYTLENRGMDVAPFLYVLRKISMEGLKYDCIIKLHSKKSLAHSQELGERWRDSLVSALLCKESVYNWNLNMIKTHPTIRMVGANSWIIGQGYSGYEQDYISSEVPKDYSYSFVAGTMFMVDFNLIMDWFIQEDIFNKFYDEFPSGYITDLSIAHQLERFFGCLVTLKGFSILRV